MRNLKIIAAIAIAIPGVAFAQVGPNPAVSGGSQDPTMGPSGDRTTAPDDAMSPSGSNAGTRIGSPIDSPTATTNPMADPMTSSDPSATTTTSTTSQTTTKKMKSGKRAPR